MMSRPHSFGYRYTLHPVLLDDLRDEPAFLDVAGEVAQITGRRLAPFRCADRLLPAGDLAVEHARAGRAGLLVDELGLEPAERLELLRHEGVVRSRDAFRAHQLR